MYAINLFAFSAGIIVLLFMPQLPGWPLLGIAIGISLFVFLPGKWCIAGLLALGFLFACWRAELQLADRLDPHLEKQDLRIVGVVQGLPRSSGSTLRFDFRPQKAWLDEQQVPVPQHIKLSWYETQQHLEPGQQWQFVVRLKRPHGTQNPGGFDYEGWLFRQSVGASGYVRAARLQSAFQASAAAVLDKLRFDLSHKLQGILQQQEAGGIVLALVLGDRSLISDAQWQRLRQAGIVHLVAISGLHIGLLAAAGFWLGRFLWRMLLWRSGISRRVFATLIAAVFALLYTALAGFSLPTVRALLMLLIVAAALLSRRSVQPLNTLLLTLLLVLLLDPFAPLSAGFWLSFFAVAVILSIIRYRQGFVARLSQLLQLQLLLGLSMLPLVAITVGSASPWGMLVNLLAIPYFSLLVVPSVLLGTLFLWISESLGNALLHFSAQSAAFILQALQSLPLQVGLLNNIHRPLLLTLLALLGMSAILLPRLWPGRYALLLLTLPWLLYRPPVLEDDVLQVAFIDVGQGLSVLLRAADETLLYDTGSAWPGSSAAERNILPLLEAWGIDELQTLVASHGDKDHAGGVPELMRHFPQAELISGEPARLRHHARPCVQGQQWQLGRAQVRVLSPASSPSRGDQSGNDNSCVLLVELGKARVLLTGDISSRLEKKLLAQSISLHSTLVSVAHHGSRYSSSAAFARTVQPQYAVVSAGYLNRYHFPTRQAVDHWQAAGAEVLNTSKTGLLNFFLSADGQIHYQAYRQSARRFWFAD